MTETTAEDFDRLVEPLIDLLRLYVRAGITRSDFQRQLVMTLAAYESRIKDRAYSPLRDVHEWAGRPDAQIRKDCESAIDRLPKEALDRSTRPWVMAKLVDDDGRHSCFSFHHDDGTPKFGGELALHSSPVDDTFLLSAIDGKFKRAPFLYGDLLQTLRVIAENELASWIYGTEPDGALAVVHSVWSLGDVYSERWHLQDIERRPAEEGGASYLMLLPKSKSWMLLHAMEQDFSISLHGSAAFLARFADELRRSQAKTQP